MVHNKILLVEDDQNLGTVIKDFLEMEDFTVTHCTDGESGRKSFTKNTFHLAIIDIMLPIVDGFSLAEYIRKGNSVIPIIFLTAKSMQKDKLKGFKIGADDYITKPFSREEFLLRINAVLRRYSHNQLLQPKNETYSFSKYTFDYSEKLLKSDLHQIQLTNKEAEVLKMLCLYKNHLLKRETALKEIWGENDYFMGRSMDVYIAKLRKYLKNDPRISIINVHNAGFKLAVEEE